MPVPLDTWYRIKDGIGRTSTITIPVAAATAVEDLSGFVSQMAALIEAVITGTVEQAGYSIPVLANPLGVPDANSDVQEQAQLSFASIEGYLKKLFIPALDEAKMVAGSVLIDIADAAVAALITGMISGLTVNAHTVSPTTTHNEDLATLDVAVETWGKRRG